MGVYHHDKQKYQGVDCMKHLTRGNKGFLFGLIGTPSSIGLSFILPDFMTYVLVPFALISMGFFFLGGLISLFEHVDETELESAYRSQV